MTSRTAKVNRDETPPFLLRVYYQLDGYPSLSNLDPTNSTSSLSLHVWPDTTLLELSHLITYALQSPPSHQPSLLSHPFLGTRLCYRHVYSSPNKNDNHASRRPNNPQQPTFQTHDLGSIILGEGELSTDDPSLTPISVPNSSSFDTQTLSDARFIPGDLLILGILPPSPHTGAIAGPLPASTAPQSSAGSTAAPGGRSRPGSGHGGRKGPGSISRGFDMSREYGGRGRGGGRNGSREGGNNGRNGYGNGFAREGMGGGFGAGRLPDGEWRRGEQPPLVGGGRGSGLGYRGGGGGRW